MDDDDGLLLNFATPNTNTVSNKQNQNVKVKGGRWKERRKLQLALTGRTKKKQVETGVNAVPIDESKRKRATKEDNDVSDIVGNTHKRVKFAETKGESGGKNDSYVSSLFTNNLPNSTLTTTSTKEVTYLPSNAPVKDATTFTGLGLNDKLTTHLTDSLRFKYPTKIQQLVIPSLITTDRDLFVKAQTGSGKTLSFVLPIFHKLMMENKYKINRESGLFAIILTPTRELATQIYGVLETLTRCHHHIVPGIVIGGEKKKSEKARLRKGCNILVATPGRLADHLENTKNLDISQLRYLILDEGDKLMELGFEETISQITAKIDSNCKIHETRDKWQGLPAKRINMLCSATLQQNVKKLGSIVLNNPEMVSVDVATKPGTITFDETISTMTSTAPDQLVQNVVVVPPKLRLVTLDALLSKISKTSSAKTIVFFSCSDSVNYHFNVFTRDGKKFKKVKDEESGEMKTVLASTDDDDDDHGFLTSPLLGDSTIVYKLHGSLSQQNRASTLQSFIKDNSSYNKVLFCTDVASRGLDLPNIANVIEYDPPFTIDDHLHRIGRSARLGNEGSATLFLLPGIEEGYVEGKLKVVHPKEGSLRVRNYEEILEEGFAQGTTKAKDQKLGKWDIHATTWHLDVERWLLEDSTAHEEAVKAFTSHIRAYATHLSTEREFFNVKLLHLGHLAKSFGLRETPKKLGKSVGNNSAFTESKKGKKEDPRKKMLRMAKMAVNSASSEFNY
ncbi:ATP-dependent RNA helicase DBP7 [Candida maltosa Xu316]|uniref:ATP-dependent RNA helicase n=1 Tax=Candida maltosa (strain Xu316) TaxID=1245528 RepID=M3JY19_CANMX|nr:ATP-dependent RNA helicase DBP7 [Candida maltosa Xu316]